MGRNLFDPWHLVVLAIIILILFGWKKLPDMTRSFGRSARILRSEMDEMKNERRSEGSSQTVKGEAHRTENTTTPSSSPGVPVEHEVPTTNPADHNTSA